MNKAPIRPAPKKILIVNCYLDPSRIPVKRKFKIPQTITPAYLAGMFSSRRCTIKLYDEVYSGPLEDPKLLAFPDMLVLTGLNLAFDRMLHITAYVKTLNKNAIVVAGGPAIRALHKYAQRFFDYCCTGDVEQLSEVIEDAFGHEYISRRYLERGWAMPRFDLVYWMKLLAYVESSRNCYFRCSYCSLTAEKGCYQTYPIDYIRDQIIQLGPKRLIHFVDNNFASNNKQFLSQRFELLQDLYDRGYILRWAGEVTCDFFLDDENLKRAFESGCCGLFCGIESFNAHSLSSFNKAQNTCMPQIELIQKCLQANIAFHYGIVFDFANRTITDLARELDFILKTPEIPLPSFFSLAIPLLKTPFFYECLEKRLFLPNLRLRDLDSDTIALKTKSPIADAVQFLARLHHLTGYKKRITQHMHGFFRIYRKVLSFENLIMSQYGALLLSAPKLLTLDFNFEQIFARSFNNGRPRTFIGASDRLERVYQPVFPIDANYRHYFEPTRLTDEEGNICAALQPDLF